MKKLFIIIVFFIIFLNNCNRSPSSSQLSENNIDQVKEEEKKSEIVWIKSGMYKIGVDLPAGEYLILSLEGELSAYYQLTKDSTGTLESIIANDNFSGSRYITVFNGQYLTFNNSMMLAEKQCGNLLPKDDKFIPGMYKIGKDIAPGEYKIIPLGEMSYYAVLKDSKNILESILTNDNFNSQRYITLKKGQYLILNDCYLKIK